MAHKLLMTICVAVLGGVFCANAASTWYVATDGDDVNNDGKSSAAPFKTIQKGIDSAANNDTVEIADGTYYISAPPDARPEKHRAEVRLLDPAKVIVDAERRCICVSNGTTAYQNIINSITFQNGYSSVGEKVAGGIFSLSKTLVTNCVVRRCYHETSSGNAYGGGVCMELDVGWCATAGEDPCAWLKRFPRRSPTIHAKEHANSRSGIFGDLPPGKKGLDWDALFAATDANGVEWYVIETESMQRKTMVPPKGCIEFLKKKGRA